MLTFTVSATETKAPHGKLISGVLESGTLTKGAKLFLHDNTNKFLKKCTIVAIFNNGRQVNSFTSTQTARRLKIKLKETRVNPKPGEKLLDREMPAILTGTFTGIGIAPPNVFEGRIITEGPKLDTFIPAIQVVEKPHIWRSKDYSEFGIALQGGGIKGAFGVGALKYLQTANILDGKKKLHLSSASTGSITSVMLAENSNKSIDKAIAQYTDLKKLEDMLTLRSSIKNILDKEPSLKKLIVEVVKADGDFSKINFKAEDFAKQEVKDAFKKTLDNLASFKVIPPLAILDFLGNLEEGIKETINNVFALSKVKLSFATLDPVVRKLTDRHLGVNAALLRKRIVTRKVTLKMAVTCLETGATCYITEGLDLLYPKKGVIGDGYNYKDFHTYPITHIAGRSVSGETPTILRSGLVFGAITSGAFPALFEPQKIRYIIPDEGEKEELFNDGGVRENLPIDILKREKVKHTIAIYCTPIDERYEEPEVTEDYSWINVLFRTIELIDKENARNDISSGIPMNTSLEGGDGDHNVLHIAPTTGTLGLAEIHPYNIKTTIWYGYMRAYDEVFLSDFKQSLGANYEKTKIELRENTEDIFLCFRAIGEYSKKVISNSAYRVPIERGTKTGNREYVMWNAKSKGFKEDERRSLSNFDKNISTIAFGYEALHGYLHLKNELLGLFLSRFNLVRQDPNCAQAFMHGPQGFMKKAILADWFGVYDHLLQIRIAANKRARLRQKFRTYSPLHVDFLPHIVDKDIFTRSNQKAPKRINNRTHPDFKRLTEEIRERITQLENRRIIFEGNITDKLIEGIFIELADENAMIDKDRSYFA